MKHKLMGLVAGLIFALNAPVAQAVLIEQLSIDTGNSWNTTISFGIFDAFDTMEAFIVTDTASNGPFQGPGIDLTDTGLIIPIPDYIGSVINPNYSIVNGASDGTGNFRLFFAGTPSGTLDIDIITWSGGVDGVMGNLSGRLTFGNNGVLTLWQQGVLEPDYDRSVPEPTVLALLSLGLVGLGFTRHKMKA